eukprot:TRINITY_DN2276_c0_g1_i1.p1 TRINITY_DN2276_c0_g1~~TRINITY_DN2276_c0_g1_i1.p1  ORF type:complete len:537 (-),score=109.05 TRINITY_DN2276_c0_g1_i1:70-1680(-)
MDHRLITTIIFFTCAAVTLAGQIKSPLIQGVNMGGWFVLEGFLNPDLLNTTADPRIVDEYTFSKYYKNDTAKMQALHNHWNTWVQEIDIQKLAQVGFTHVRIPVPHWSVETPEEMAANDEFYETGQWDVLPRVIGWLHKYGIKALIEIHSAIGSQNGYDNSGMQGPKGNFGNFPAGADTSVQKQLVLMDRICQKILAFEQQWNGTVVGFGVLNEPNLGNLDFIKNFYLQAYPVVRSSLPGSRYWFVIDHAYFVDGWMDFMQPPQYENVILDIHVYHCFDDGLRRSSYKTHADVACGAFAQMISSQTLPTIVGEWSIAFKLDSHFAATEAYPTFDQQNFAYRFALLQMLTYGSNFYWNFKTPSAPYWDYFLGYDQGFLPQLPVDPALLTMAWCDSNRAWGPYDNTSLQTNVYAELGLPAPSASSSHRPLPSISDTPSTSAETSSTSTSSSTSVSESPSSTTLPQSDSSSQISTSRLTSSSTSALGSSSSSLDTSSRDSSSNRPSTTEQIVTGSSLQEIESSAGMLIPGLMILIAILY